MTVLDSKNNDNDLFVHLKTKDEDRNQNWDDKFFKLFSQCDLKMSSPDPQQGPDGWPYLMTEVALQTTSGSESQDSAQKILNWLSTRGIGLVVNPLRSPYPDFVFSYGMIWSFRETGFFIKYEDRDESKLLSIDTIDQAKFGPPTEAYFPIYARKILKAFLLDQSVFDPKILMVTTDGKNYDLCFSLESLGSPKQEEHDGILEAIAWFLPPHYSLAIISEIDLPPFTAL